MAPRLTAPSNNSYNLSETQCCKHASTAQIPINLVTMNKNRILFTYTQLSIAYSYKQGKAYFATNIVKQQAILKEDMPTELLKTIEQNMYDVTSILHY